ncbi:MAG: diguanylate cyclase [Nitrospirales bacterium]|nr:MAG: diguanylate cyclase [Nitrospirales bacterium]
MDKYKILIVDDDPNVRKVLGDTLTLKGYETFAAKDGTEALSVLKQDSFNLVLTDLGLPNISGLEVLHRVKADYPLLEVIILTGNATLYSAIESTNKGAFSYLQKPYDMDQLLLHIKHAIEKQQAEVQILQHSVELKKINSELKALYEVSLIISRTIDLNKLFSEIVDAFSIIEVFSFVQKSMIFLIDKNRTHLVALGLSKAETGSCDKLAVGDCLCGLAAKNGEIIVSKNCGNDIRHKKKSHWPAPHGHIIVPLKSINKVEGVLCLFTHPDIGPDEHILNLLLTIGNQLGIAIENLKLYEEAKSFSLHDPLTGLANRRLLQIQLEKSFEGAKRYEKPLSIIMLDIDYFKKYNDTYGHVEGDRLLVAIANILLKELRSPDYIFRYGGEEFLIMLPEIELKNANIVAERLRKTVASKLTVTISLGVSSCRQSMQTKEDLINNADTALYQAKQNGRNRVEINIQQEERQK